jgi:ADP-ribose pyrophosphatase YjhB (NUDIX family)
MCTQCGTIHYQNPRIVAGCILHWHDQILLCRRAIEPRLGYWTLPAGFMENGETTREAAAREALEEAEAIAEDLTLYAIYNLRHIDQVYMMFRGQLRDGFAHPGQESLETRLFYQEDIPWDTLAFTVVRETLQRFFAERPKGRFPVHYADVWRQADGQVQVQYA